jgi:hypothetical protein
MSKSVRQGFDEFLSNLTPTPGQFSAATTHRSTIESCLDSHVGIHRLFESGSLRHGTGVRGWSDSDLMVSVKGERPSSDSALNRIKAALSSRYPLTTVKVSRPAVVCSFSSGDVEVVPAYARHDSSYWIPAPGGSWLISAPKEHNDYVTQVNTKDGVRGGAKGMARLLKAWKYFNNVPVSSFYLEMRSAEYMNGESSIVWVVDVCRLFEDLERHSLASMNDPKGVAGRISACSSDPKREIALSRVKTAASRARRARDYHDAGNDGKAFEALDLLFNGRFPGRW